MPSSLDRISARGRYRIYRARDAFEIAIPDHVIERGLAYCRRARPREWYGAIVGTLHEDDAGRHMVVRGIMLDPDATATTTSVRSTLGSEAALRRAAAISYPDAVVLGWCHGHPPGIGAFYSQTDRENQRTWSDPDAIGIVFEADDRLEIAVFRGPLSEPLERVADPKALVETTGAISGSDATGAQRATGGAPPTVSSLALARAALGTSVATLIAVAILVGVAVTERPRERDVPIDHAPSTSPGGRHVDVRDATLSINAGFAARLEMSLDGSVEGAAMCSAPEEVPDAARHAHYDRAQRGSLRRRTTANVRLAD
jgi:proteasome lid subunit RPN8/RPN11